VPVKAGEEKAFTVTEECEALSAVFLGASTEGHVRYFLSLNEVPPALKAKLVEARTLHGEWTDASGNLGRVQADVARLTQDQDRIRKNLANTPKEAEVYQVYLKKLSDQEKEIDTLTARQKELMGTEFAAKKKFEDFVANLSE
jgi:hypothetical protein